MKRFLSLLLAVLMVLSLVACAKAPATTTPADDTTKPADTTTEAPAEEPADEPTEEPADTTDEPAEEPVETPVETAPEDQVSKIENANVVNLPLVTEPTTLRFWWPSVAQLLTMDLSTANDYLYFREMEKRSGVTVEIEVPNDAQTQFGLMMASEEYPDFVQYFGNYYTQGLDHAVEEDLIVALEDYTDYIPNIWSVLQNNVEARRQVMTDEGHLPGIPQMNMRRTGDYFVSNNWAGYVIREDFLSQVGMEVPTTYAELGTLLEAMKTNFGTQAIPFQLSSVMGNVTMALGMMFWSGYGFTNEWMQKDGEVMYSLTSDGFKEYLMMLNEWWEAGYMDPDLMSKVSLWTDASICVSEQYGVFPIIYTHMGDILKAATAEIPEYNLVPMAPLKVTEDAPETVCFSSGLASVNSCIMASSENIELVCQWWDYWFSEEGIILSNYGLEGEHFNYDENGIPKWIPENWTSDDPQWNLSNFQYVNIFYNSPGYIEQDREWVMSDQTALDMLTFWNENSGNTWNYPAAASMTASENEDYASVMGDITTYVGECSAKFMIGDMSFDEWDTYVEKIEQMGLAEAVECKQAAYDRYMSR